MVQKISYSLFFLTSVALASAPSYQAEPAQSTVEFVAIGKPSLIKIKGTGPKITGSLKLKENNYSGDFSINLDDFNTGIDTRDKHMKEKYLETSKPGNAVSKLHIASIAANCLDAQAGEKKCNFQGDLTLHGITKPITGDIAAKKNGSNVSVTSNFKIKLADFAIQIPSFAGVTVADDVSVTAELALK